ncbi:hypothetical protein [Streptococcus sp. DD13]|nr:hypothetical protein [Streptococcus sp. DD13]KXT78454.1 hypothetical protein STRDD13_00757 [Streptococcus sp. DD13]
MEELEESEEITIDFPDLGDKVEDSSTGDQDSSLKEENEEA